MGSSTFPCGYALNTLLDEERARRQREGITDLQSWQAFNNILSAGFPNGAYAERCGEKACLLVVHQNHEVYSYCRKCFVRDMAIVNGYALLLDVGMTGEDAAWIHKAFPYLVNGFPEVCAISIKQFERAISAWRERGREKYREVA